MDRVGYSSYRHGDQSEIRFILRTHCATRLLRLCKKFYKMGIVVLSFIFNKYYRLNKFKKFIL